MFRMKEAIAAVLAGGMLLTAPTLAFGQDIDYAPNGSVGGFISSSTSTTTTTVGIAALIYLLVSNQKTASAADVAEFLEDHRVAVNDAIHLGGGSAADDLIALLGVPAERERDFKRLLRARRAELAEVLARPGRIEAEDARVFIDVLADVR